MRAIVWILMLVGAQAFVVKPTPAQDLDIKRIQRDQVSQSSDNCRELSEAFRELARHSLSVVQYAVATSRKVDTVSEPRTELNIGFDIINDDVAREAYTCALTQAGSLSALKAALENNNFLYNLFRMLYDSSVIGIQMAKSQNLVTSQAMLEFVNAVESVGLLDLDSALVAQVKELVGQQLGPVLAGYKPTERFVGRKGAKCAHVNNAFGRFYHTLNLQPMQKAMMQQMIGIDISDNDQMRSFFCNLIDGAEGGVAGLYAVLDRYGIISSVFRSVYALIQTYVPIGRAYLEQLMQDELSQNNGQRYPGNGGVAPGELTHAELTHAELTHAQLVQLSPDVVRFLQALENSGLLSFANDL